MNLRQSNQAQQEREKERLNWNNRKLAEQNMVFCIRGAEMVESPFKKGAMQWEVSIWFVADKRRNSAKIWFASNQADKSAEPTKWDDLFSYVTDWPSHNVRLAMNVPGDVQKGYHFDFLEESPTTCPCQAFTRLSESSGVDFASLPPPAAAQHLPGDVPLEDIDSVLSGMGFEPSPPITEAQQQQLLTLSARVMTLSGKRIDPGNFETMTSGMADLAIERFNRYIDANRAMWLQQSASKAKTEFSS